MTPEQALTGGFQRWLEATVPSKSASVKTETVDPYASSMRYPWQIVEGMRQARSGSIVTSDPPQRFGDLQRAGLLFGSAASANLTPLGEAVLTAWERHDLLDQTGEARHLDFARSVVMVDAAWKLREARYLDMLLWWSGRRSERPAADWFGDDWSLVAATYFGLQQDNYNPYRVMVAAGTPHWAHRDDLRAWASAMPKPSGWPKSRLGVVLDRIDGIASRSGGKIRFYQALEAVTLRNDGMSAADLKTTFLTWGI